MLRQLKFSILILLSLASAYSKGQTLQNFIFFSSDTLHGFDLSACMRQVVDERFTDVEMKRYVYSQEREFVDRKYRIQSHLKKFGTGNFVLTGACNNLDFETGDYTGWTGYAGYNSNSDSAVTLVTTGIPPNTLGINSAETSCSMFTLVNAAAGADPYGAFPMLDPLPGGGSWALRLGGENANLRSGSPCSTGGGGGAPGESIQQTFQVTPANALLSYNYAVVLVQAPHSPTQCPYFRAEVLDQYGKPIPCMQYYVESVGVGVPTGMTTSATMSSKGDTVYYSNWKTNSLNLKNYMYQNVTVRFSAAGCVPGGHWGYAYVDANCSPIQVIASTPEVCLGGTLSLTAPGAGATGTYAWTTVPPGGAGIVGSNTGQTVTVNANGTYEVTVTQSTTPLCQYTIDTTIAFYPNPTVTATSTNASCSPGNDGTATATVTGGNGPYTYAWAPSPGAGGTTATPTSMAAGTYTVTVTTANGCTASTSVTITQPPGGPTVTVSTTPASCSPGNDGTATATVTGGTTPYTYSWTGGTIGGGQGSATITGLPPGSYTCVVNTPTGTCPGQAIGTVTSPATPPVVTNVSTNVSCFGRSDGTATVTATSGNQPLTYSWTGSPSTTPNATGLAAGSYTCTITDNKGCSSTSIVTITQPSILTVNATGVNATCNAKCNGQLIGLPSGGTSTYTYAWNNGQTNASCTNICAGTYTLNITDSHGCAASDTALVTQPPPLVMTLTAKPAHCNKSDGQDSVFVSGGTPGYTYSWKPGAGSASQVYHNIPGGVYTVFVKDNNGCPDSITNTVPNLPGVLIAPVSTTRDTCFGAADGTATVAASGGFPSYTYSWNPAPAGGQGTVTATGLPAGLYTCTVTDSAHCSNSVVLAIGQPTPVTLTAGPPATICIGGCTVLSATAGGGTPSYNYTWTLNGAVLASTTVCPLVTTTYTVACSDSHGCLSPQVTVRITVNPPLEVLASGANKICPGGSTTLGAIGSGGNGNYSYTWSPTTGLSNPNIPNPVASPMVTTTYTVILSDNCGTPTDSDVVVVTVFPPTVVNFTSTDTVKCAPVCVTFTGTSTPACATGSWTFGDGGTATACNTATHCYLAAGNYSVTYSVIDINGCPGSHTNTHFINAMPVPEAAFNASPQPTTILDPEIFFTDQSSSDVISWNWNLGDLSGATSTLQNPKYIYPDTGCYQVTLIVTNAHTCSDTISKPVCIQPYFTFYAPNTFTPNGDGKNDVWMPYGIGIDPKNYHLMMFDRWGNLMFETYVWGQGWDGRANNGEKIAQIDTYVWKIDLKDVFHNKHQYIGHCNIIK